MGAIDREYIESLVDTVKCDAVHNKTSGLVAMSCTVALKNGFTVNGICNVLDQDLCDEDTAMQKAYDRALDDVVRLEAYRQRENERLDQVKTEPPQNQEESQTT